MDTMDVNGRIFCVKKLLGKGKGGYSYLAQADGRDYVVKQIHHEPCDYYQFGDKLASELRDYERLRALELPMPELMDVDMQQERILKEYMDGPTVDALVLRDALTADHLRQVEAMCRKLYAAGLNIDYFPTNFVEQNGRLYYIDYECNDYMEQWDFEHWGKQYWSKTTAFLERFAGETPEDSPAAQSVPKPGGGDAATFLTR